MHVGTARLDHPEVAEIVPSAHCVMRFRQRMPVRDPGIAEVAAELLPALEGSDITRSAPAWAVSDRSTELWAIAPGDAIAFPLAPGDRAGRWVAVTCLAR